MFVWVVCGHYFVGCCELACCGLLGFGFVDFVCLLARVLDCALFRFLFVVEVWVFMIVCGAGCLVCGFCYDFRQCKRF